MNQTPNLVTSEVFNDNVKAWANKVKAQIISNAPRSKGVLTSSIITQQRKIYNVTNAVKFKFAPQGIYVHYGVGRGLSRSGGRVIHAKSEQNARYRKKDYKISENQPKGREAIDFFNSTIRQNIENLADITQEYYGDEAMKKILNEFDRMIIKSKL